MIVLKMAPNNGLGYVTSHQSNTVTVSEQT